MWCRLSGGSWAARRNAVNRGDPCGRGGGDNGKRHAEIAVRQKAGPRFLFCGEEGGGRWQSVGGLYRGCDEGGMLRPGRVLVGRGAAPLRRLRRHLPLQGRLYGQLPLGTAPLQGELDAPQGAARGVHCRLAAEISCKAWQNPALCFVGDDLRAKSRHFVPAALRNAACGRQCSHRPAEPCGGLLSPFRRPCAPHCRAGVHARRGSLRRGNISVLHRRCPAKPCDAANPKRRAKPPALQSPRKWAVAHKRQPTARPAGGPEGYLQGPAPHPSAACGGTSPYRGGFIGNCRLKRLPCKGNWLRRKAQPEGCIAALPHRCPSKIRQCPAPHP